MSEAELQKKVEEKIKKLAAENPVQALTSFLVVRPVGIKNKDIIRQDLQLFQNIIGKLLQKDYDLLIQKLNQNSCELLIDYLHRFMQYIGESQNQTITSGNMLKLYERVVKQYGPTIIIKACTRPDTLVTRIQSY